MSESAQAYWEANADAYTFAHPVEHAWLAELGKDARLLDYYNRELTYMHELGAEFAQRYPKIAGRLGMRAATAELAIRHAKKIPRRQLVEGLRALYDADSRLKSGSTNDRAVMEFVVARLTA